MKKLLIIVFISLIFIIFAETGYYLYLTKTTKNKNSIVPNSNQNLPIVSPTKTLTDWKPWQPTSIYSYQSPQYGRVWATLANLKNKPASDKIVVVTADQKELVFKIASSTEFFSREELPHQPAIQKQESQPFSLIVGKTYLLEWLENQPNQRELNLWRISRLINL
jgi:hypothetical protein